MEMNEKGTYGVELLLTNLTIRTKWLVKHSQSSVAEFGDGLGALSDGVAGELTGEDETDGGLDLAGAESVALVVADESGGLTGDALEDVADERVEDAHGLLGDASLGVDLLEDAVDVHGEGLGALLLVDNFLGGLGSLGGGLS